MKVYIKPDLIVSSMDGIEFPLNGGEKQYINNITVIAV